MTMELAGEDDDHDDNDRMWQEGGARGCVVNEKQDGDENIEIAKRKT